MQEGEIIRHRGAGEGWELEEASRADELVPHKNAPIMDI